MTRYVDAEDRSPVLIMDVVVGDAGAHALVLHAPAASDRLRAGVRTHVVVDVEHDGTFPCLDARRLDVLVAHAEVQTHGAERVGEATEYAACPARRRGALGAQEHARARRREPTNPFDAAFSDRERTHHAVQRDPQRVFLNPITAILIGAPMETEPRDGGEHQPGAEVLNEAASEREPRGDALRAVALLGRPLDARPDGRARRSSLSVGGLERHPELRIRGRRGLRDARGRVLHTPRGSGVAHRAEGELPAQFAVHRARPETRGEHGVQPRAELRRDLAIAASVLARDDGGKPLVLMHLSEDPKRLGYQVERRGEPPHARGLVGHQPDQEHVAMAVVAHVKAPDQRAADEDVALVTAVNHASDRGEPTLVGADGELGHDGQADGRSATRHRQVGRAAREKIRIFRLRSPTSRGPRFSGRRAHNRSPR